MGWLSAKGFASKGAGPSPRPAPLFAPRDEMVAHNRGAQVGAATAGAPRLMDSLDAWTALVQAPRDDSLAVRCNARQALEGITGQDFGYDVAQWTRALRPAGNP